LRRGADQNLLRASVEVDFPAEADLCACGERIPAIAGLCSKCYRMRRRSQDYFGGNREIVLFLYNLLNQNRKTYPRRQTAKFTNN
jgi:hypothetical protein